MENFTNNYPNSSRLQNWENKFSDDFEKIECIIDTVPVVAKGINIVIRVDGISGVISKFLLYLFLDATFIRLTELTEQIVEWERKLINYNSEHKTEIFHDFNDFKTKLLIQLDSIDISSSHKINADRSRAYDRLEKLTRELDKKIHEGHFNCSECVQVKEVAINL